MTKESGAVFTVIGFNEHGVPIHLPRRAPCCPQGAGLLSVLLKVVATIALAFLLLLESGMIWLRKVGGVLKKTWFLVRARRTTSLVAVAGGQWSPCTSDGLVEIEPLECS